MRDDIIQERKKKLEALRAAGVDPYPTRVKRSASLDVVCRHFSEWAHQEKNLSLVGRVWGMRDQGNLIFLDIADGTGMLQGVLKKDNCRDFQMLKDCIDIGDFVELSGVLFLTKRGEQSIEAHTARIITKSLRPLPSAFYGIEDIETRLRKRYLDLALHKEVRDLFIKKEVFWHTFRDMLRKKGFLEVETPVLEPTPGGAEAEPFVTHHNALDTDFYLRISPELSLKRLLVGGYEKVFEIGRIFRNEGIDAEHLQDYTQLEFYWAYVDYRDLMKFLEAMYKSVVQATMGTLDTLWHGHTIHWGKKWDVVEYFSIVQEKIGLDLHTATIDDLRAKAAEYGIGLEDHMGRGRLIDVLFKKCIRPELVQPTFLIDPPVDIEPLAKRKPGDEQKVERVQIVACGTELGKGFSELNDPLDQRRRFEEQMNLRKQGDKEAQYFDEDFVEALAYGMPPAAGFGVSERLFSILVDKPVRETVFFPLMRRKEN
ncbi:MAG: lysine--tRNA ligase [Patescibacteria group bacterium]|nr:lysine--tRNA ligase [Patescibacteria group bacterium]MDE2437883.1 lysine--tRNA ligase [Patescibacteria group bacterium]